MLPTCTTKNSLLSCELASSVKKGALARIRVVLTCDGSFVVAHTKDEPVRPVYLTTRRDRTTPKVYIDNKRLSAYLTRVLDGAPTVPVEFDPLSV